MENLFLKKLLCSTSLAACVLLSFISFAAPPLALSGPSQAVAGDTVTLSGARFGAGTSYKVQITIDNHSTDDSVTADANGHLHYQLVTSSAGAYRVFILDADNKLIASSMVIVRAEGE